MQRALAILSTALVTAGAVILADVAVTLAWQEPVTAISAKLEQRQAGTELERLSKDYSQEASSEKETSLGPRELLRRRASRFAASQRGNGGGAIGRIRAERIGLDQVLVNGTDTETLRRGPGRYPSTGWPGRGRTVGVAGHRTTYGAPFRRINEFEPGDVIEVQMPYGTLRYGVEQTKIVEPTRVGVVRDVGGERIVLTACHPLYSAAKRIVVFASLESVTPTALADAD